MADNNNVDNSVGNVTAEKKDVNQSVGNVATEEKDVNQSVGNVATEEKDVNQSVGNVAAEEKDVNQSVGNVATEEKDVNQSVGNVVTEKKDVNQSVGNVATKKKDVNNTFDNETIDLADLNNAFDPFADVDTESNTKTEVNYLHIRVQQRNGRKTLTTLQGLPKKMDSKKILKVVKKAFACNGTVVVDEEHGDIVQLQGDHRSKLAEFLIAEGIAPKSDIKVHGF